MKDLTISLRMCFYNFVCVCVCVLSIKSENVDTYVYMHIIYRSEKSLMTCFQTLWLLYAGYVDTDMHK
jgi:hypothetical protein